MKLRNSFAKLLLGGTLAISSQLLAAKPANAALLAQYNLDGNLNNSAPANPNLTVSQFTDGPGLNGPAHFSIRLNPNQTRAVTFKALTATDTATSIAGNFFYSFTVAPTNGYAINLQNLSFATDAGTRSASNVDFGAFFVRANFGPGNTFVDVPPTFTQPGTNGLNFQTRNLPLSGFFTKPLEFRIYLYDNAGNNSGGLRVDDVRLTGSVQPVPELSTGLLVALSLGGLCLVGARRKKGATPSMTMAL